MFTSVKTHVLCVLSLVLLTASVAPPSAGSTQLQESHRVTEPFQDYYDRYQGIRVLGYPMSDLVQHAGYPAQYFEKGRIEDHRRDEPNPNWVFMYGRLTAELMESAPLGRVSSSDATYSDLKKASDSALRSAPPPNFTGGTMQVGLGMFVPFDAQLRPAPGYIVTSQFWQYINRIELFPGGWLHDIGLPMTAAFTAKVAKNGEERTITMQAFERAVLSYDPRNPLQWQVERGNIGADAVRILLPPSVVSGFEYPTPEAQVTLPVHMQARVGQPGQQVIASLRWDDGVVLTDTFTLLKGEDGRGLLIDSLDWVTEGRPPQSVTNHASLEIRDEAGVVLARSPLTVLPYNHEDTMTVQLYWVDEERLEPVQSSIVRTEAVGSAALEELLWGPPPKVIAFPDFGTALPMPEEVLAYPGRGPDWGPRVMLRKLTIEDGVATADFSKELRAYGGGSTRVTLIREQITRTLKQFPTIREVRIAIEGQTEGVLEP
jgi:hypothetical protein